MNRGADGWPALAARCRIWVRGAGELGSACALSLARSGFPVVLTDLQHPLAIRRTVCFSEALHEGSARVEDRDARQCRTLGEAEHLLATPGSPLPVLADPGEGVLALEPAVVVDARLLKTTLPDQRNLAPLVIGLGPGHVAQGNCHRVVETLRGHELGRVLASGAARPDTGVPGLLGGEDQRRVIHAPVGGTVRWTQHLGALVVEGQTLGCIGDTELPAPLAGLLRGQLREGTRVPKGTKLADIDPRGAAVDPHLVSDKARCVARGVLEAVMEWLAQVR